MPILIFSPVYFFLGHPLEHDKKEFFGLTTYKKKYQVTPWGQNHFEGEFKLHDFAISERFGFMKLSKLKKTPDMTKTCILEGIP